MISAKAYLEQLIFLTLAIASKEVDYEMVLTRVTQMTQQLKEVNVQTSRDLGRQEEDQARLADISVTIDKLRAVQDEARRLISLIPDYRYQAVLTQRYICSLPPWKSADMLGYSESHERMLHRQAIRAFAKVFKDNRS